VTAEYVLGEFQVRPAERSVVFRGEPVALGARAFDLLLALIEHRDRILGKDELLALVWPALVVEEGNLAVQVSTLRKLLGSDAIATIPGRGYRFTAPLHEAPRLPGPKGAAGFEAARLGEPTLAYEKLLQRVRRRSPTADVGFPARADPIGWVPAALTPLLGRAAALDETLGLLDSTRCLTLTGAGGSGKTRLALAMALTVQAGDEGAVWWVELAKLTEPKMLAASVAQTVGVSDPRKPALQCIVEGLKGRRTLLVLDNCEHLVDDCAELAVQLLRALPSLRLLATSRESLRIAGEVVWRVPALKVPPAAVGPVDDLLQHASVALLVERIRQHSSKFAVTPDNAASLVQICRRLDGLPLALELIAAQVGLQSLSQVVVRLDRSLRLMTIGERGGLPHHQTMAAAIDWGYQLLTEAERALFVRLSVFVGGWTLEGAEAAAKGLGLAVDEVPELLGRLERVSMVVAFEADDVLRFRMLEPIRQFATAKLEDMGLTQSLTAQMLAWYVSESNAVAARLTGREQAAGYQALTSELDNLRALLRWSQQGDIEQGLRLASTLWRFWQVKGHAAELLRWFHETLPLANDLPILVRAEANNAAGVMARTCGLYADASRLHTVALDLQRAQGNRRGEAIALNNLCVVARDQYDHPMVEQHGRATLAIAREIGDKNIEGLALMHLGTALRGQNRLAEAEASFRQSFEIFSDFGDRRTMAALFNYLGNVAQAWQHWPEAARCFSESLAINQQLDDSWGIGISTFNQASLHCAMGDHAAALPLLSQSLSQYGRAGAKHGVEEGFGLLALISQRYGQLERAAWCWGVIEQLEADIGKLVPASELALREQTLRELEAAMGQARFDAAKTTGLEMPLNEALLMMSTAVGLN